MSSTPILVIVGAPGAGKTTVGTAVAERLGCEFCDTDQLIELHAGKTVQDIFVDDGEQAFRDLEVAIVAQALSECSGVLSLGGGAVMRAETQTVLQGRNVLWLDVSAEVANKRVGLGVPRPVLLGNVRKQLATLLAARRPVYEAVATITVDSNQEDPEATVERVLALINQTNQPN